MKQNKFIILSALLALSAATPAEAQIDAADSAQVNVAFRKVAKEDIMGGVSSVNYRELMDKNYNTYRYAEVAANAVAARSRLAHPQGHLSLMGQEGEAGAVGIAA